MSTLVSEIVVQAFREGNFTAVGETTTAEELMEAVPRLNNFISALLGTDLGEQYRDWYVPQAWNPARPLRHPLTPAGDNAESAEPWAYPPANVRLMAKLSAPRTLFFPPNPSDGARMAFVDLGSTASTVTLSGNDRLIENAAGSPVAAVGAAPASLTGFRWLYRADLGTWVRLRTLQATDSVPLPPEFDDLLIAGLCIRLAPRFGVKEIDPAIIERREDMLGRLKRRYKQSERMPTTMEMRTMFRSVEL